MTTDYASLQEKLRSGRSKTSGYYNAVVSWTDSSRQNRTAAAFQIAIATEATVPSRNWSEILGMELFYSGARPQELPLTKQP
jgi:hypothetical protein